MSISEYENEYKQIYCCREVVEHGFFNDKYEEHYYSVEAVVEEKESKSDEISASHSEIREEIDELIDDVKQLRQSSDSHSELRNEINELINDVKKMRVSTINLSKRIQMLEIENSQISKIIYNMGIDQAKEEFKDIKNQILPILSTGKKSIVINIADSESWRSKHQALFNQVFLQYLEIKINSKIVKFTEDFLTRCEIKDITGYLTSLEEKKYVFVEVSKKTIESENFNPLNSAINKNKIDWIIGEGPTARPIEIPINQLRYIVVNLDDVNFNYSHFISISF